jgi:serine/threonine protein kinase
MNDLLHGAAFLESLGLAHGDLSHENVLLDRGRLKLAHFDCTAPIGSPVEVGTA